ncbi:MAG: hypothetical protein ACW985_12680, partial [Candidatus Thorarchaeota archaeon]
SAVKTDVLKLAVRRGSPERQIATFYSRQTTPSLLDESTLTAHQSKIKLVPDALPERIRHTRFGIGSFWVVFSDSIYAESAFF